MGSIRNTKLYFIAKHEYYRWIEGLVRKIDPNFKRSFVGEMNIDASSRYCYSVFMRHIVHLFNNGMQRIPDRVAEFGPGNSLGIGLCSLLAGAKEYYALDAVEYTDKKSNLEVLDRLVTLFKEKAPIPNNDEFPEVKPLLDDHSFPHHIFDDNVMEKNLSDKRVNFIRNALSGGVSDDIVLKYIVPWENYQYDYPTVDFIMSQAVLEHVDNLEFLYGIMNKILVDGGFVSHDIDFRCHGETYEWNGHWAISDRRWKTLRGTRPYVINREPLSAHLRLFEKNHFQIKEKIPNPGSALGKPSIKRNKLAGRYKNLSDEDFETSTCFVIAQKTPLCQA